MDANGRLVGRSSWPLCHVLRSGLCPRFLPRRKEITAPEFGDQSGYPIN